MAADDKSSEHDIDQNKPPHSRREFLRSTLGAGLAAGAGLSNQAAFAATDETTPAERPNILWLTCEDIGPHLGCFGDDYADTPALDAFAARSLRYDSCWSTAPVCAPARTTIITGMYPPSTGSEHMRSLTRLPEGFKMFPQYLRTAGYYCTNNAKEDYNLVKPGEVWDDSSRNAHWKNRDPGQPFFAVFNSGVTHESRIRSRPHEAVHDPANAPVPAYQPDTPEVRRDWAQYYDTITTMDRWAGDQLKALDDAGLADDTIVFFYGDHGSGMPRSKRWPYHSGLHVPLIIHIPPKFQHLAPQDYQPGGSTNRLVGFVDLAPTVISLAGIESPNHFQGHAFLGVHEAQEQPFQFGFRGRMDERYDMVRTVRDKRYHYIRNYMPHKIYGQYLDYMFQTPTTRVWKELYDQGKLTATQRRFWETKPPEELYDLQNDPDEINNLAESPEHKRTLEQLRRVQREWALQIRDVGFLPEDEMYSRAPESSPYGLGHDATRYPLDRILPMAEAASSLDGDAMPELLKGLSDEDSAVRYWAAMGFLMHEREGVAEGRNALRETLAGDASPNVRVVAAEALGRYGDDSDLDPALNALRALSRPRENSYYTTLLALNAIDALGLKAAPLRDHIAALSKERDWPPPRGEGYTQQLAARCLTTIG